MSTKTAEKVVLFAGLIYGAIYGVSSALYWNFPENSLFVYLYSLFDGGLRDFLLFMAYVLIIVLLSKIDRLEKANDKSRE